MKDFEARTRIRASAADTFRYLSSIDNLPEFLPHVRSVKLDSGDHIFAVAELNGKRYEMDGYFRPDEANNRIDWGSDGTPPYQGWLEVRSQSAGDSELMVHLSMELPGGHDQAARERLCDTLATIRRKVEGQSAEQRRVA